MADRKVRLSRFDLGQIVQRIELSRKYYEQVWKARDELHARLYKGDHLAEFPANLTDNVTINYTGRNIDLSVAALAAEPPIFRFRPIGRGQHPAPLREALARVWEAYLPTLWRANGGRFHREMKAMLRDAKIHGRGWVAIDWLVETRKTLTDGDRPDELPDEQILYDDPIVRRVSPSRLFLDPAVDTLTWEDAGWIVWEMVWPLDRVKRWAKGNPRVNKNVAGRLKGDIQPDAKLWATIPPSGSTATDDTFSRATIWRYHERDRNLVLYIAKEVPDEPLLSIENPYDFEGYPFEPLFERPVIDKLDAIGRAEVLRGWQRLFNLKRSKEASMIRTARHFVTIPSSMTEEDIQSLESDQERVIIKIDPGASQPPREVNTSGFPPEFIQVEAMLRTDYTELTGINAMRRGLTEPGIETLGETQLVVQQSGTGERDEQAEWESVNQRVCRKVKALLEQFADSERLAAFSPDVARGLQTTMSPDGMTPLLTVEPGQRFTWVGFTPQQIADEAEVEVLAGSMGAREEALERAQFNQGIRAVVEVAVAAPQLQAMGINPQEVAKEQFRRFGNLETDRFFQKPQPMALPGAGPAGAGAGNGEATDPAALLRSIVAAGAGAAGGSQGGEGA